MLYRFKGRFQKFAQKFAVSGMTANQASALGALSVVGIMNCFLFGLVFGQRWALLLVPPLMVLRLVANALDGMIARATGTASPAGELMNELLDVAGDTLSYGVFLFIEGVSPVSVASFLVAIWAAEFVGVLGRALPGQVRRHESLLGGKSERAVWASVGAILLYVEPGWLSWADAFFGGLTGLALMTAAIRYRKILQTTRGLSYESHTSYGR